MRPLAFKAEAFSLSSAPFVVIATVPIPRMSTSLATSLSISFLTSGSPPLRRTFLTPMVASIDATRVISSKERTSDSSSHTGLSGMQKSHRKLHLSVTEILSLRANLP